VFEQVRPCSNIQLLSFSLVRSRTWSCSKPTGIQLDTTTERASVTFEVDAIDQATRTGWSMVVGDPWPNHPPHPPGAGIINISSVIGEKGNIGQANYAAAKSGLFGLTNSLALKTARNGITVNSVAPGEMVAALPEEALQRVIGRSRWGAGASRTMWPGWWRSWPTRSGATSPGRATGSTAASACAGAEQRSDDLPVVMR
jgi:NAD(P)-dependent dehydrogenase (short-subunit alcohol dehydrogenase family)